MNIDCTTAAYQRSHGTEPRGHGVWAFRLATSRTAYELELFGPVVTVEGTFAKARVEAARIIDRQATDAGSLCTLVAVLP